MYALIRLMRFLIKDERSVGVALMKVEVLFWFVGGDVEGSSTGWDGGLCCG